MSIYNINNIIRIIIKYYFTIYAFDIMDVDIFS
jgi:hypothetical protein